MKPSPGGGHSVGRFALLSLAGAGSGLQDAVLVVFLLETLRKNGADRFLAFVPLGLGALVSVVTAPLVSARSYTARRRQAWSFTLLFLAVCCSFGLAQVLYNKNRRLTSPPTKRDLAPPVALAALQRALTQTANFVPVMHDAARVRGTPEDEAHRRAIATACFYVNYRAGFIAVAAIVAVLPNRAVEDLFLVLTVASAVALLLTVVALAAAPPETHDRAKPSFTATVKESLNTSLYQAHRGLLASYVETFFYALAFGQIGSVMASFFNDEVFKVVKGQVDGVKWASYSTLAFFLVNIVADSFLARVVIKDSVPRWLMGFLWIAGAFFGCGIFVALKFIRFSVPAMISFALLAITTSTHNIFSLACAAGYVEPKHRPMSFAIRAAMGALGTGIGAFIGGFIAEKSNGFDFIMAYAAICTAVSGVFAAFGGSVSGADIDGAAINLNPLLKYLALGV